MLSLQEYRNSKQKEEFSLLEKPKIIVGMGTCGIAAGAEKVYTAFENLLNENKLQVKLDYSSCLGICHAEVNVEVVMPDGSHTFYENVLPLHAEEIINGHIIGGKPVEAILLAVDSVQPVENARVPKLDKIPFYLKQTRQVLKKCGRINPDSLDAYIAWDGYVALENVLRELSPEQVISDVKSAGLRGRGGAGFPTGLKWEFARKSPGETKYIICNADEGDPGAFMDRAVLEGDPHAVLEGMAIAGYAIGASEGYIYVRAEYPLAISRLQTAIANAEAQGVLGKNILDSGFDFSIKIKAGAGAFVCGEETALIASIEGERGTPRVRPPYPAVRGLWGKPTNINNVESYANVPHVFLLGPEKYSAVGTDNCKGTKIFAVTGKVKRTGLAEVPMGITLREIIYDIAGGIADDKAFKAVQIGGPSGGCLPAEFLDLPVDYDSLKQVGAMMGSGGLVVMDETTCMVDLAKFFLSFTQHESCGKCTPCREGTKRMLEILEKITDGKGEETDIITLEKLAKSVSASALCGLGQAAPNPVLATLKYFKNEFDAHIKDKTCPAGVCSALLKYVINKEQCKSCGLCEKTCPVSAITGKSKTPYMINSETCIKCGVCMEKCPFDAIAKI